LYAISEGYQLFPTGIINSDFKFKVKNYAQTRNNFLWLGTDAFVHKGLDLLIDVFSKRDDVVLHICGITKKQANF